MAQGSPIDWLIRQQENAGLSESLKPNATDRPENVSNNEFAAKSFRHWLFARRTKHQAERGQLNPIDQRAWRAGRGMRVADCRPHTVNPLGDKLMLIARERWPNAGDALELLDLLSANFQNCDNLTVGEALSQLENERSDDVPSGEPDPPKDGNVTKTASEKTEVNPPPEFNAHDSNWILGPDLSKCIGLSTSAMSDCRKEGGKDVDQFGKWGVDSIGVYRADVDSKHHVAYYIPDLKPLYATRLALLQAPKISSD